jgi:streptogramin lyase
MNGRVRLSLIVLGAATLGLFAPAASSATTVTELLTAISPGSGPAQIITGPDGNLWITTENKHQIDRLTPAGVLTQFSTGISSGTLGITTGPGGDLWFTEFSTGKIGKITTGGAVVEFSLSPTSQPAEITAGADGNLWFTESAASKIGRITPAGTITEFTTPTANADPRGITAGPDGNLWFTERSVNRIGRITPTGARTDFSVGITPGGGLNEITAGPGGDLWFTEPTSQRIGRITPAGVVTEFPIGFATNGIAVAPDGNLWYSTYSPQNGIGRLTPTGTATEFSGTLSSSPGGITTGPDGNMWFVEYSTDKVGRATVDHPVASTGPASVILATTATVSGSVDPQQASVPTSYHFDYGPTSAYGLSTPSQTLSSGAPSTVTATLSGLTTSTGYHYRLVASNATGASLGADQSFTTPTLTILIAFLPTPVLTGAAQSHSKWRAGNKLATLARKHKLPIGTTFSFTLNQSARVSIAFTQGLSGRKLKGRCVPQAKKKIRRLGCTRILRKGTLTVTAHAGKNKVSFQGRISRSKKLKPGRYVATISATSPAGQRASARPLRFAIVK